MTKNAVAKREHNVLSILDQSKGELSKVLPRHLSPERMTRIFMTEARKNDKLMQADPYSFIGACMACSELGLEPGSARGHAYLIPFYNKKRGCYEVQMIPGYKGLIDLAKRSGEIAKIAAYVVHAKDEFDYELGMEPWVKHKPYRGAEDHGEITDVYAVAKTKDGEYHVEVMSVYEVNKIRDNLPRKNQVWEDHYEQMARKTVVRRICKYLPLSPEVNRALEYDDALSNGSQDLHVFAEQKGIAPKGYEPTSSVSAEATTPAQANADIARENKVKEADELRANLSYEIERLKGSGFKYGDILAELGVGDNDDWSTYDADQLAAMIAAVRGLEQQAANA